jgi:hypothetical protein
LGPLVSREGGRRRLGLPRAGREGDGVRASGEQGGRAVALGPPASREGAREGDGVGASSKQGGRAASFGPPASREGGRRRWGLRRVQ